MRQRYQKNESVNFIVNDKIVAYQMKNIEMPGCNFEICKLQNVGKNALDFYIALKIGEIFAVDKDAKRKW